MPEKENRSKDNLIIKNMHQVRRIAKSYAKISGIEQEELEGYGYEGLVVAANKFDGIRDFSNYASSYITGYIKMGITQTVYKRGNLYFDYIDAKTTVEKKYNISLADKPELIEEVIELLVATGKVRRKNEYIDAARRLITYFTFGHASLNDGHTVSGLSEYLTDPIDYAIQTENSAIREEILTILKQNLRPIEFNIIKYIYGFDDGFPHTKAETARMYHKRRSYISQTLESALKKLSKPHVVKQIEGMLEGIESHKYGR